MDGREEPTETNRTPAVILVYEVHYSVFYFKMLLNGEIATYF
jgi:hypothetical protein